MKDPAEKTFNPNDHLTKLSGKDYLEVKWRLAWFRDQYPNGIIETEHIELTDQRAIFKATVTAFDADRTLLGQANGYGSETPKDFKDYIEKAETKAVGRALAALGFGTQFAPELDEGSRIVDSPVQRPQPNVSVQAPQRPSDAPKPANAAPGTNAPKDMRAEALGRTLHGLAEHDFLHALAVKWGFASFAEVPADNRQLALDYLNGKGEPPKLQAFHTFRRQWEEQHKRASLKPQANGLLPGVDAVPNTRTADSFTN